MKITNNYGISLPLAVWLLTDDYDYNDNPNYISATSLLKSTKQIVLSKRVASSDMEMDISDKIAAKFGHATHDSIENAWKQNPERLKKILKLLNLPEHICERIVHNPGDNYLAEHPDALPVYTEKRVNKDIAGYTIGGKYDMVIDGHLFDYKTTSVYSFIKGNKDGDYALQGSIYKWLNPEIITDDFVYINFIFTDWQKAMTRTEGYPPIKIMEHPVTLLSMAETEAFLIGKITELKSMWTKKEEDLPPCTDKELWRSEPQHKYYSDPTKTDGRSTRNFDNLAEANAFFAEKGKGIVKTIPGEVKACGYCPAYPVCKQREQYNV